MHLLAAKPGKVLDGSEAIDLGQTPGDIVVLSAADTDLACLAAGCATLGDAAPDVRLASLLHLQHPMSVDLYVDEIVAAARMVVVRLIGGVGYWSFGIERVTETCRKRRIPLAIIPGDDKPDPELARLSTLPAEATHRVWRYMVEGGVENAAQMLAFLSSEIGTGSEWQEPRPLPKAGYYLPDLPTPTLGDVQARWSQDRPVACLVFYRSLVLAGNTAPVDAMIGALSEAGVDCLPVFVSSLKELVSAALLADAVAEAGPSVILNGTAFAVSSPGSARTETPFEAADAPVLQVIFSGAARDVWAGSSAGLSARDIAMNIALPEVDGRLTTRAVSFKAEARRDEATQCPIVTYAPEPDRIAWVAALAANWARLRQTPAQDRRVAIVLANYPMKDGRLANGVGLDTPAGTVTALRAMRTAGYAIRDVPISGDALIGRLVDGPTNKLDGRHLRRGGVRLSLEDYNRAFVSLPAEARTAVTERWGPPESDPFVNDGGFTLSVLDLGGVVVGIQPSRGYDVDPTATYHDPDLVPPHGYFAFYIWMRTVFGAHVVIHFGKHGNLEWLPGKALALSGSCFPEAAFWPVPHLYPFIVNDPGEGTQAKRRTAAVVVDHLTPPLTRAGTYGPLRDLEVLVDEYFEATTLDPRRLPTLAERILEIATSVGLDADLGFEDGDDLEARLAKLDAHLCELKEMQIRDGLHVFGESPQGRLKTDLVTALARVPRGSGEGADASLQKALAADLGLEGFDPLDTAMDEAWSGPRPDPLAKTVDGPWRTAGDTVERLEELASHLVSGEATAEDGWTATRQVLQQVDDTLRPAIEQSGPAELEGLLSGLDGRFVAPGPSGAPTRGRPDVLPTGRNFYSVDTRAVPTPAAWRLGWRTAGMMLDRYRQEHGGWPKRLVLSAWGTANMRTGGDDIAQALALLGARPDWDSASGRVTGFEILPLSVLDRPRVDVTFRISGFFRDAFPFQIDLVDSAVRAVAALDEPEALNPLAARARADAETLCRSGVTKDEAEARAAHRVFGSKPGAYGAGLQALIDNSAWESEADLAEAYLAWGGWAYGKGTEGAPEHDLFRARLGAVDLVIHNQDNREHDILDSDDYYQFEGGVAAAVRHLSGQQPEILHGDTSRPDAPRVRTLKEEIARVVRARVVNPKWIEGVMRHGYKGGFEMAATVDYLFAFAATARVVGDHHFDLIQSAWLEDEAVRSFLERHNPAALEEIAHRLMEAVERGLWRPKSNTAHNRLASLAGLHRRGAAVSQAYRSMP